MSIQDIENKRSVDELDISDLDMSPLFMEPPSEGLIAKILPWATLVFSLITLIIVAIK